MPRILEHYQVAERVTEDGIRKHKPIFFDTKEEAEAYGSRYLSKFHSNKYEEARFTTPQYLNGKFGVDIHYYRLHGRY